jgi:geranylgeranyl diphosphate synthase type II
MNIKRYLTQKKRIIDRALKKFLPAGSGPGRLAAAMRHSALAPGKRIRPILTIASAHACGGNERMVIPTACAIELIHTFTLIHDDLPAIDNSSLRRGRQSCHKAFGESAAILAGDALQALAIELIVKHTRAKHAVTLKVLEDVLRAIGLEGVVGGEMLDIEFERSRVGKNELRRMYGLKTGALIRASVRSGAILSGAGQKKLNALTGYAKHLGVAFQIADDLLDVRGSKKTVGKPVGRDKLSGKATYPVLVGAVKALAAARLEVDLALDSIKSFGPKAGPLRGIAEFVLERKK